MPNLLLELFSEEIPARMQAEAAGYLAKALGDGLHASGYQPSPLQSFVSPRRLAVMVDNLPLQQADVSEEIKGPKVNAPEAALAGFLKKTGLSKEQLVERDGVYFAMLEQKGKQTTEVLKIIIEEILVKFPWPKSMRWGSRDESWVRPLHSIVCVFGSDVVPVEFAGIKAGNTTQGHRFLAPDAITLFHADQYEAALEKAFVIASRDKRKASIRASLEAKAAQRDLRWQVDDKLLDEVAGLVEWPVVMFGTVNQEFMHLPPELLTTVMRSHQKYFTLLEPSPMSGQTEGVFSSTFAFAANRDTATHGAEIIAGNERVLRARFSDAKFFYEQDQKKPLAEWNKGLEKVTFHAKIGTVAQKVERIQELASALQNVINASLSIGEDVKLAASLCKADLTTGMVGEFPELQGIMGSYYAKAQGYSDAVAEALYHLYDNPPSEQNPASLSNLGPVAQIICLADRLDNLISLFSIGEKPTGSKDPYALRRAALGVISIIWNHNLRFGLKSLLPAAVADELLSFFNDRLEVIMREKEGIEPATLRAIGGLMRDDDIIRVRERSRALHGFLQQPESAAMLAAYKRAANILAIESKKDSKSYTASGIETALLQQPPEKTLYTTLQSLTSMIEPLFAREDYAGVMTQFATLKAPLDDFFNDIMVNTEDAQLRANRLSLLAAIIETMNKVADFSQIA